MLLTASSASSSFAGFLPPAVALSGRPPPPPPTILATSLMILPACAPFLTASAPQTQSRPVSYTHLDVYKRQVQYQNEKFQTRLKTFTGWTAQIIQHEIDHCEGIIILEISKT